MNPYHDAKGRFAGRSANSMPTKKELSTFHTRSRMATLAISGMRGTVGEVGEKKANG